ncbi:MAG: glycoside hydrolase family 20 zincin-like fold domain-containing protein, partial [Gemmatimonadota bacterium]
MRYTALSSLSSVALAALVTIGCETAGDAPSLIPAPEHLELRAGTFSLEPGIGLVVSDAADDELVQLAKLVADEIGTATGLAVRTGEGDSGSMRLILDPDAAGPPLTTDSPLSRDESYSLTVAST